MRYHHRFTRIIRRFAIFPIIICGEYRWLETVYIIQRYNHNNIFLPWYNDSFTTKSKYIEDKQKWFINSRYCKEV